MPQQHMDGLFGDANVTYKQSIQFTFTSLNEVRIIKSYIEATQALHSIVHKLKNMLTSIRNQLAYVHNMFLIDVLCTIT